MAGVSKKATQTDVGKHTHMHNLSACVKIIHEVSSDYYLIHCLCLQMIVLPF